MMRGMARLLPLVCVLALFTGACSSLVEVRVAEIDLPAVAAPEASYVHAADGSLIATLRLADRDLVDAADVPQVLRDAMVAAEDRRFYEHDGVDVRAIARALLENQRAGEIVQGGSTITQQLVKNRYFPDPANTLERKATEAHLARRLEAQETKAEILLDYLNTIYFGDGAFGIGAAARRWFGVTPDALTLAQAALLAGLVRSPESASPATDPARALVERGRVLDVMVAEGMVTATEAAAAGASPLGVRPPPPAPQTRYPYFVEQVKRELLADPALGVSEDARVRRLFGGGLRIQTTLDPRVQAIVDEAAAVLDLPGDPEVGVAVVEPSTGHVVATRGGRDFAARQFDLATQSRRSPGSTMKTFALVAALVDGHRLDDLYDSGSTTLQRGVDLEPWRVRSGTSGLITLADALADSSNGAFARLALDIGPQRISGTAQAMGVDADLGTQPAVVLGGVDEGVSPLDLASGYATLANGGVLAPTSTVAGITDRHGEPVAHTTEDPRAVVDPASAYLATSALAGVLEDGTGTAAALDRPAAGKTGTSQDYADAWFVGYTPELATAVWVGHPEAQRPLYDVHGVRRVEGGTWPARIWREVMSRALAGTPPKEFPFPERYARTVMVDPTSGGLATQWCPLSVPTTGLPAELPLHDCPLHGPPPPPPPETSTAGIPVPPDASAAPGPIPTVPAARPPAAPAEPSPGGG